MKPANAGEWICRKQENSFQRGF